MAAFNWIYFDHICPVCKKQSKLKSQTHVASDFDGIGERFCMKTYILGEKMLWWSENHPKFHQWKQGNLIDNQKIPPHQEEECCYTECLNCGTESLYAIILFENLIPIKIKAVGLNNNYPKEYSK